MSAAAAPGGSGGLGDVCFRSAREQRALLVAREITARELLDAHLRRIDAVNPQVNAIVTLARERAYELADRADGALATASRAGSAARPARRPQGPHRDARHPHDLRLAGVRRLRAVVRLAGRRAARRGGRRQPRQEQRARVGHRVADLQPGLRRDPQPLRPRADLRRQHRRRRRRARDRAWRRSPTARTWAGRCATRRASATSSACARRSGACRAGPREPRTSRSSRPARWRAPSPMRR